jgi:hypothetical protein
MVSKPGFGLILDVSTDVLPNDERDALQYAPGTVIPREYGAFVHVPIDTLENDARRDPERYVNFPVLLRVLRWAVKQGAFWVLFDGDGVITELPEPEVDEHPQDCAFCAAGEGSEHNYEPPAEPQNIASFSRADADSVAGRPVTDGEYRNLVKAAPFSLTETFTDLVRTVVD